MSLLLEQYYRDLRAKAAGFRASAAGETASSSSAAAAAGIKVRFIARLPP